MREGGGCPVLRLLILEPEEEGKQRTESSIIVELKIRAEGMEKEKK